MKNKPDRNFPDPCDIAKEYEAANACDFPAEIVLSAVNSNGIHNNPTVCIPMLKWFQIIANDLEAISELYKKRECFDPTAFLANPNSYFQNEGIKVKVPFDDKTAYLIVTLFNEELMKIFCTEDKDTMSNYIFQNYRKSKEGRKLFTRKDRNFEPIYGLEGINTELLDDIDCAKFGLPANFGYAVSTLVQVLTL